MAISTSQLEPIECPSYLCRLLCQPMIAPEDAITVENKATNFDFTIKLVLLIPRPHYINASAMLDINALIEPNRRGTHC